MNEALKNFTPDQLVAELVERGAKITDVGCGYSEYKLTKRYSNDRNSVDAIILIIPNEWRSDRTPKQE